MQFDQYNHYRHGHHPFTWGLAQSAQESKTMVAMPDAIALVEDAIYRGNLLTPVEAMALACGDAKSKETLYSIALRLSLERELDLDVLLAELGQRFPGYT